MKLYYMRDDHSFRALPLDIGAALDLIVHEFSCGYTSGSLCSKSEGTPSMLHAHGRDRANEFFAAARDWLTQAINYKSPADIEYASWAQP